MAAGFINIATMKRQEGEKTFPESAMTAQLE